MSKPEIGFVVLQSQPSRNHVHSFFFFFCSDIHVGSITRERGGESKNIFNRPWELNQIPPPCARVSWLDLWRGWNFFLAAIKQTLSKLSKICESRARLFFCICQARNAFNYLFYSFGGHHKLKVGWGRRGGADN